MCKDCKPVYSESMRKCDKAIRGCVFSNTEKMLDYIYLHKSRNVLFTDSVLFFFFFNDNLKRALVLFLGLYSVPVRFYKGHCILEHYFCVIMLLNI